ncbi:MAG: vitamin K epoxide reductase family protein [Gemmataceae bacterium]|nr:vitamin K epoxide reductase family protein [Gemmataceae bacterium]
MSAATGSRAAGAVAVGALALALIGMGVAGYLAVENLQGETGVCVGVKGCATVQESRYGEILGMPVSVPGFLLYAGLAAAAAGFLADSRGRRADFALVGFLGALAGLLMSAYLTFVEAFVLDAWCSYCIVSALLTTGLFAAWSVLLASVMRGPQPAAAPPSTHPLVRR